LVSLVHSFSEGFEVERPKAEEEQGLQTELEEEREEALLGKRPNSGPRSSKRRM